jgi:hypothetical protein
LRIVILSSERIFPSGTANLTRIANPQYFQYFKETIVVNIEELELSLRTEFEGQVRNVLAGIKQDVADFQKNFEAEFEKHRAELDKTISDLSERLPETTAFDAAFMESVTEHLRLARDDGAQIAATAFGEAEKLKEESTAPASYNLIRDAINDISSKNSQASILTTLVDHAEKFTSRGAFFIVKNDHFVGWRVFGDGVVRDEKAVRDLHFPVGTDTILSASVNSMSTAESSFGDHIDNNSFLDALGLGHPDRMYAIPLTARGRGVAVLYADRGTGGIDLNLEALETLVRVAGLTVELLAASQAAKIQSVEAEQQTVEAVPEKEETAVVEPIDEAYTTQAVVPPAGIVDETVGEEPQIEETRVEEQYQRFDQPLVQETEAVEEYTGIVSFEEEPAVSYSAEPEMAVVETTSSLESAPVEYEEPTYAIETNEYQGMVPEIEQPVAQEEPVAEFAYDSGDAYAAPESVESVETYVPAPQEEVTVATNGNGIGHVAEPVVEVVTAQPGRTRLSDRNVDLPIEVADEERRLHNDARRFARLLVSEIKLYNEQKVVEGRESSDLYDRLREAIDRSREMYDKRVQPAVASKFDYFHYELVNSLAEGEDTKLGGSYPGAVV